MTTPKKTIDLSDVYTDDYTREIETYRKFVSNFINQIFLKYFLEPGLFERKTQAELLSQELPPSMTAVNFVKKMIQYYEDKGSIEISETDRIIVKAPIVDCDPGDEKLDQYLAEHPDRRNFFQILRNIRDVIDEVLFKGEDALLTMANDNFQRAMELWEDLMVNAKVKKPCHQLVIRALINKLSSSDKITVFEGGAGVGSILRDAMAEAEFASQLYKIETYHFTDISLSLIKLGRKWLRDNAPAEFVDRVLFKVANLDKMDAAEPFMQENSLDAIILEHVLYDVIDLQKTLTAFRRLLKPGGILTFTMAFRLSPRHFFPFEFLQSSFQSYNKAKLEAGFRENLGYLTMAEWDKSLKRAGFEKYEAYPDAVDLMKWPYGGIIAHPSK